MEKAWKHGSISLGGCYIYIYIYIYTVYIYIQYIYIYRVWIFTVKHEYRIGCNGIYHQQCDGEIMIFFCGEDCKRWDLGPGGSFGRTHLSTMIGSVQVLYIIYHWLVVWNMNFIFPYIGNVITNIFQRGRSTTNQIILIYKWITIAVTILQEGYCHDQSARIYCIAKRRFRWYLNSMFWTQDN